MLRALSVALTLVIGVGVSAHADIIHLKDGTQVEGKILEKNDSIVKVETAFDIREIPAGDVTKIEEKKFNKRKALKAEFKKRKGATDQKDPDALLALALWANENGLRIDYKRTLRAIIKDDVAPDHEKARELLGYKKFEGEWKMEREIERILREREEAEMLEKGLVKYQGKWIPKEDAEALEKGLVKYEGKWMTPEMKDNLENGRQLFDGEWLSKEERDKRTEGLFKVGEDWVTEDKANEARADISTPWRFEGSSFTMSTNNPYKFSKSLFYAAENSYDAVLNLLIDGYANKPKDGEGAGHKPSLVACVNEAEYTAAGNQVQDDFDAVKSSQYSQFCTFDPTTGVYRAVAVYALDDTYTTLMVRQAAAELALRAQGWDDEPPRWLIEGMACHCGRYYDSRLIAWNVQNLRAKGGLIDLKDYFDTFVMSQQGILQAGLILTYITDANSGCHEKVVEAWNTVKSTLGGKAEGSLEKAIQKLERALVKDEKNFVAYADKF